MFALTLFDFNVVELFPSREEGRYGDLILFFVVLNKCSRARKQCRQVIQEKSTFLPGKLVFFRTCLIGRRISNRDVPKESTI